MLDITGTLHFVNDLPTHVGSTQLKQKVYETSTAHINILTGCFISEWAQHLKRTVDKLQGHQGIGYVQCKMKQTDHLELATP